MAGDLQYGALFTRRRNREPTISRIAGACLACCPLSSHDDPHSPAVPPHAVAGGCVGASRIVAHGLVWHACCAAPEGLGGEQRVWEKKGDREGWSFPVHSEAVSITSSTSSQARGCGWGERRAGCPKQQERDSEAVVAERAPQWEAAPGVSPPECGAGVCLACMGRMS